MFVFGNDKTMRGCFASYNLFTQGGRGARITFPVGGKYGVTLPSNLTADATGATGGVAVDPIIVTGITYAQKEKFHLIQCFSDFTYTYAFGHDAQSSMLEIQFVAFLVASGGTEWSKIAQHFNDYYKKIRLIQNPEYAKVYIGSGDPLKGFVVGMKSSTADAHHNLQNFSMTLLLTEAQG